MATTKLSGTGFHFILDLSTNYGRPLTNSIWPGKFQLVPCMIRCLNVQFHHFFVFSVEWMYRERNICTSFDPFLLEVFEQNLLYIIFHAAKYFIHHSLARVIVLHGVLEDYWVPFQLVDKTFRLKRSEQSSWRPGHITAGDRRPQSNAADRHLNSLVVLVIQKYVSHSFKTCYTRQSTTDLSDVFHHSSNARAHSGYRGLLFSLYKPALIQFTDSEFL